ncbi:hypothetical protein IWQ60_011755 [Tieghemiomyces parasiticus]|uniref:SHSP domain-containing protein n=1 Tax=Tieghemiomyces parasiticus TaxID=78921 RepID=A0A9W7ZIZ1_9FUNG|nr:hypothetical protein IWQ60_011755 [Tieghemiomyces parasiticus]
MSCSPFCEANFWDLSCSHKQLLVPCKGNCGCLRIGIKPEVKKTPSKPATPPPASKAPTAKPATPPPNPHTIFTVPIQKPKNPPPPAFDVDDNPMRFQVTMKWDISKCPAKCDVSVVDNTKLTIKAAFATDKKDVFDVFERTIAIPDDTVAEKAEGKYKDGVLVVEVPKLDSWKRYYL